MNDLENVKIDEIKNSDVDKELIKQIIKIQDLPEEVVIKFLEAKGSLSSSSFRKQYRDEHR